MKLISLAAAVLALAACSALPGATPGAGETGSPGAPTQSPGLTMPTEMSFPPELGEVPQELFLQAAQEAAAIANVAVDQVAVQRAERVTWRDGALGCPEPGQMYTQALVPGYWLVLEAGSQEFDFRISEHGEVKLCPQGQGQPPIEDQ